MGFPQNNNFRRWSHVYFYDGKRMWQPFKIFFCVVLSWGNWFFDLALSAKPNPVLWHTTGNHHGFLLYGIVSRSGL
jgi:hypothetical protein